MPNFRCATLAVGLALLLPAGVSLAQRLANGRPSAMSNSVRRGAPPDEFVRDQESELRDEANSDADDDTSTENVLPEGDRSRAVRSAKAPARIASDTPVAKDPPSKMPPAGKVAMPLEELPPGNSAAPEAPAKGAFDSEHAALDACEDDRLLHRPLLGGMRFGIAPQPMTGASWLNRPLSAQLFTGAIFGDDLIDDNIRNQSDIFSGVRLGWDWSQHWGGETRLGFSQVGAEDIQGGVELADTDIVLWDIDMMYYPTGDTRLRPYLSFGLGLAHFDFQDADGIDHQKELVGMPLAMGLKYRAKPWFAARLDLADNIALPNAGVNMQHNFSITLSAEIHFGGERTSYWPWNPTLQAW